MRTIVVCGIVLLWAALLGAQQPTAEETALAGRLAALPTAEARRESLDRERTPVTPGLIQGVILEGKRRFRAGDYSSSLDLYQFSLGLAEASGEKQMQSSCLYLLSIVRREQGEYELALDLSTRSLALAREGGGQGAEIADTLSNIATILRRLGDYPAALRNIQDALAIVEPASDKMRTAMFRNHLALIYRTMGDYRRALESYQSSLALGPSREGRTMLLNNIGGVYLAQGNLELALDFFQKSLQLIEEIDFKGFLAAALMNVGSVYQRLGRNQLALDYLQRCLRLAEAEGSRDLIAQVHLTLAKVQQAQGKPDEARRNLETSVSLYHTMHSPANESLALSNLAGIEDARREYAQAAAHAKQALELAREVSDPPALWSASNAAARANRRLGKRAEARAEFLEAIDTIESLRGQVAGGEQDREQFFEDKIGPYLELLKISIEDGKPKDALAYAERAKARVLLEALRNGRVVISKVMTAEEKSRERTLLDRMAELNTRLKQENSRPQPDRVKSAPLQKRVEAARREYAAFQGGLYASHPELRASRLQQQPATLGEMAAMLPDEQSVAIEYVVTENETYLFVVSKREPLRHLSIHIPATEWSAKVRRFSEKLGRRDLDFGVDAQELYRLLVAPAAEALRGKKTLVIVPDGVLWQLPFQALQPEADHYLLERMSIFYAPSLTVLSEMLRRHPPGRPMRLSTVMAVGNPAGSATSLPEAESEVAALRAVYGAANSKILIGEEATEAAFKQYAGRYAVLHVAAHAVLDDRSPLYSHLVLMPGSANEDGMLEAREMMDLDLNAEIVVLSACETAQGHIGDGEGLIGMTWALFIAGSPATVATSWKIDSASAARFTVEFHRRLKEGQSKAAAIRLAALALMRLPGYEHPYYWSSFSLLGQGF